MQSPEPVSTGDETITHRNDIVLANGLFPKLPFPSVNSHNGPAILELRSRASLELGLRRGEFAGHTRVGKADSIVAAIAERLVLGLPAAAERDRGPSGESEGSARRVDDLEIAFDAEIAVGLDGDFGWHGKTILGYK